MGPGHESVVETRCNHRRICLNHLISSVADLREHITAIAEYK